MIRLRNSGISLLEIMAVVAIIGVLAAIAVPSYTKYKVRVKQSQAKSELATVFTANTSFKTAHHTYFGDFPLMGFIPTDVYPSGGIYLPRPSRWLWTLPGRPEAGTPVHANFGLVAPIPNINDAYGYQGDSGGGPGYRKCGLAVNCGGDSPADNIDSFFSVLCQYSRTAFKACATGCPLQQSSCAVPITRLDVWTIDQDRVLTHVNSGE